jgi:V/A-type H+-transporting ATPase subunit I
VIRQSISESEFLSDSAAERAWNAAQKVNDLLQSIARLQDEENHLTSVRASLLPWSSLDLPLEAQGTKHVLFRLGVCPSAVDLGAVKTELAASDAAAELLEAGADRQQHYLLLICHRADDGKTMDILRTYGFSVVTFPGSTGTAAQNIQRLDEELSRVGRLQNETKQKLSQCDEYRDILRTYADRLASDSMLNADEEHLLTDGTIVFFEGWCPASTTQKVQRVLEQKGCAWEISDPAADEYPSVPVKLQNNRFTRPLNLVTDMYALPAYDGVDPNPLMAPFFILFYGIMMADMGYGIVMIVLSLLMLKKVRPKGTMRNLSELLGLCGVSTLIMGAITGGFFGDFLPQLAKIINPNTTFTALPALFTPLNDTLMILIGSLVLGFIQVLTGMAISFVKKIKDGNTLDAILSEGTWWIIYAGTAMAILKVGNVHGLPIVLIVGGIMLVIGSSRGAKGFGKVGAVIGAVYNGVTGIFSDVMSYSRLMALMLAGSIIAQVFNSLGSITNNVFAFVVIAMIGNTLNFLLNILGCFVHDLRLQCLEYFGKFYKEGGKRFRPLEFQTKYVDIKEED